MPDTPPATEPQQEQPQALQFLPEDYDAEQEAEILRLTQENFDLRRMLRESRARERTLEKVKQSLIQQMNSGPGGEPESLQVVDGLQEENAAVVEEGGDLSEEEKKSA